MKQQKPAPEMGFSPGNSRGNSRGRRTLGVVAATGLLLLTLGGVVALQQSVPASATYELDADRLYDLTNVWTVHLKFTPDQWEAMEPKGGANPFGGFGGGGPRPGPGGRGGFSVAMLLSPAFLSQGDTNRDDRLSRAEFAALAQKWFQAWDTNQTGKLDADQIRAGLNAAGNSRAGNPPAARGRGGPGRGMMLQGPEGKRNGLASAMGIEFVYVHADLEFEGRLLRDVAVRYKGNGTFLESRGSLKRSLKVDLNHYVKGQGLGEVTKLTLQNNVTDASLMNEVLAYRLYRDAGVPTPRTSYAKVFITVPGKFERQYFGLYSISENVGKQFAARHFGTKKGAIFKPVTPALFNDLGPNWAQYNQTYDPKTQLFDEQKKRVMELCRLVTEASDTEFAARIGQYLDLPEFARYLAVTVYLTDLDGILGPGQNFYLHLHPKTQLFQFIPWDQDHSWGQFNRASQEQREQLSILHPWQGENIFLERMVKVEAFKKLYLARMEEFSQTIFAPERFARQVDELAAIIRPAVQEESAAKLERFDQAVAGEILTGGGFGPFGGSGIKPIKPFTVVRTKSVRDQVAGRSEGLVAGGFGFPGGRGGGPGGGPPQGGGPGGPGGPGGRDGRGGRGGFGPGMIFAEPLLKALDEDKDSTVTRDEFTQGLGRLFEAWNTDKSGSLTEQQLRSGIEKDLSPPRGGFPPFGRPPGQGSPPAGPDQQPPP